MASWARGTGKRLAIQRCRHRRKKADEGAVLTPYENSSALGAAIALSGPTPIGAEREHDRVKRRYVLRVAGRRDLSRSRLGGMNTSTLAVAAAGFVQRASGRVCVMGCDRTVVCCSSRTLSSRLTMEAQHFMKVGPRLCLLILCIQKIGFFATSALLRVIPSISGWALAVHTDVWLTWLSLAKQDRATKVFSRAKRRRRPASKTSLKCT